jgi:hypothetical protein
MFSFILLKQATSSFCHNFYLIFIKGNYTDATLFLELTIENCTIG